MKLGLNVISLFLMTGPLIGHVDANAAVNELFAEFASQARCGEDLSKSIRIPATREWTRINEAMIVHASYGKIFLLESMPQATKLLELDKDTNYVSSTIWKDDSCRPSLSDHKSR